MRVGFLHWLRHVAAASSVLGILALVGCARSDGPPEPSEGQATIGAGGGTVQGPDGVAVVVPQDVLASDTTIRVARDAGGAPEVGGLRLLTPIYQVTPHGAEFEAPVRIRIPFDRTQQRAATAPVIIRAQAGSNQWEMLPTDVQDGVAAADSFGFSYYAVGECFVAGEISVPGPGPIAQCPSDIRLRLTLRDGTGALLPQPRSASGTLLPAMTIDAPTPIEIGIDYERPPTNVADTIFLRSTGGQPAILQKTLTADAGTSNNYFVLAGPGVTIDPAQIYGASSPLGKNLRIWATVTRTFDAFYPGCLCWLPTSWTFTAEVMVKVVYRGVQPTITQQPINRAVTAGQSATFTVAATAPSQLSYQWQRAAAGAAQFADIAGATLASYTTPPAALADDGSRYRARLCTRGGRPPVDTCVYSNEATLSVSPAITAPVFTQQPQSMSVVEGQTASFTATATGTPTPTVRWYRELAGGPVQVGPTCSGSGGTTACTYTTPAVTAADNGARFYALADNGQQVRSDTATLTVTPAATPPVIPANEPADVTVATGQSATFSVNATGTAPLSYQWQRNGTHIAGANGASYTLGNAQMADNGARFRVIVTNGAGSATSREALLTVTAPPPPDSAGACFGDAQGWCFVAPKPQANNLTALAFDTTSLMPRALGALGVVVRSSDLGATWTASWDGAKTLWNDVARLPSGVLFATGQRPGQYSILYRSNDDGATWTEVDLRYVPGSYVLGVAFANANVGIAFGSSIWRTTDGGATWSEVATNVLQGGFPTRIAANGLGGFVLVGTSGFIAHSADGGATWTQRASGTATALADVAFNVAGVGIAVGETANQVLRTTDGGLTWSAVGVDLGYSGVAVAFADSSTVVAFNRFTGYRRSTDGGLTWADLAYPEDIATQSNLRVRFGRDGVGLAVGDYGLVLRSVDSGATWARVAGGRLEESITALESRGGVTLAGIISSELRRSTDGGVTWSVVPTAPREVAAVSWGDASTALAVRRFGSIHRTTDAGANWTTVYQDSNAYFSAGAMASATTAVVAGHTSPSDESITGFMLRTTDGGQTWSPVALPTTRWLWRIRFLTPLVGLAGGGDATLLRTQDGGLTWTAVDFQPLRAGDAVHAIARVSDTVAIIATDSELKRSTDGGLTWTRVYESRGGSMTGAAFREASTGVAVGVSGILRTVDGGTTWTRLDLPIGFILRSATWPTPTAPLVGGDGGALLRNQRSGAP